MKKHQVDLEPLVIEPQLPLPSDEAKIVAQFEQKRFQVLDERFLQIALTVLVFQVEEFEHKRVTNFFLGGDRVARLRHPSLRQHRRLVAWTAALRS